MRTTPRPAEPAPGATGLLLHRNFIVYRSAWKLFLTGFLEPVFYLFSIGIGVGQLIDSLRVQRPADPVRRVRGPGHARRVGDERRRCSTRPSTSSSSCRFDKLYDQMLATPLSTGDIARGEIAWCLTARRHLLRRRSCW